MLKKALLLLVAVFCLTGTVAHAQRRIDRWERRELRMDRRELRQDRREIRRDRREFYRDLRRARRLR